MDNNEIINTLKLCGWKIHLYTDDKDCWVGTIKRKDKDVDFDYKRNAFQELSELIRNMTIDAILNCDYTAKVFACISVGFPAGRIKLLLKETENE
jgi:hypothetical protein